MEAGVTSDILFIPFLVGLLLFGLIFAMVGFWRVGASYATQRSAQVGSVAPDQGNGVLSYLWQGWTGSSDTTGSFGVDSSGRTVHANIDAAKSFNSNVFGAWMFDVGGGGEMHIRSERFYPGQPECDEQGCNE
jgi:hypothetical protein